MWASLAWERSGVEEGEWDKCLLAVFSPLSVFARKERKGSHHCCQIVSVPRDGAWPFDDALQILMWRRVF